MPVWCTRSMKNDAPCCCSVSATICAVAVRLLCSTSAALLRQWRTCWRGSSVMGGMRTGVVLRFSSPLSFGACRRSHVKRPALQQHGASFFFDLVHHTGMLRTQVEESLGDLAARGLVTADSYAGLRALITPAQRKAGYGRHARRRGGASIDEAGRWELLRKTVTPERDSERIEHIARALLRRYGVVFRKLLERESKLPTWRELLYVYRRMEARGELRGGRFVQGYSGEQFALPEAGGSLRDTRKRPAKGEFITLSAADPLNLAGILTPGTKVPALAGNRVLFRDGVPVAATIAGEFEALQTLSAEEQRQMRERLAGKFPTAFSAKRPA